MKRFRIEMHKKYKLNETAKKIFLAKDKKDLFANFKILFPDYKITRVIE